MLERLQSFFGGEQESPERKVVRERVGRILEERNEKDRSNKEKAEVIIAEVLQFLPKAKSVFENSQLYPGDEAASRQLNAFVQKIDEARTKLVPLGLPLPVEVENVYMAIRGQFSEVEN